MIRINTQTDEGEAAMTAKILIAIPHNWLRDTVYLMISGEAAHISCVATMDELSKLSLEQTDVVLIDLFGFKMPYMDVMKQVSRSMPKASIIALLSTDTAVYRDAVMRAGANMVIPKEKVDQELVLSLIQVLKERQCNEYIEHLQRYQDSLSIIAPKEVRYVDDNKETTLIGKSVTRRAFLKGSAAAAAVTGIAMSNPGEKILYALAETSPETAAQAEQGEQIFRGVCRPNCMNACGINAHVQNGRVVKTTLAPMPDPRYNRICLRGLSHVQRMYGSDRIKYPMKRAGKRGEDKWERISWDEAIDTITDKFNGIREKYGNQALSFTSCSGSYGTLSSPFSSMYSRLKNVTGATYLSSSLDVAWSTGFQRVLGGVLWWHSNEPTDYVNARTIIIWGLNPTESFIQQWHFISEAVEAGAKLIVIDPVFTQAAAKADMYVPIRNGSDPALLLAMMQVIIKEDLTDKAFLRAHTVAPFLVRADTKKFLRNSDLTGSKVAEGQDDPFIVWDELSNRAGRVDQVITPALEGSFEVNGISVTTAFSLLKELVNQYPPEVAAKLTDISPEVIRELALTYASKTPSTIIPGLGCDRYYNGQLQGHALATLAAITGNVGKPGASVGMFEPQNPFFPFYNILPFLYPDKKTGITVPMLKLQEVLKTGQWMGKPHPIKALFVHHGNPLNTMGNQRLWLDEFIPAIDFIVVADINMGDTARYADIVLPVAHWFEQEDMILTGNNTFLQYQEKATEPAFEAKTDMEIARLLARGLGVENYFTPSDEDFMRLLLDSDIARAVNVTYDRLKKEKVVRWMPGSPEKPFIWSEGGKFPTPTGRAEFYIEDPKPMSNFGQKFDADGERLPYFRPPIEAWPEGPLYKKYPLVCTSIRERWRVHSQWANTPWLRELDPEPTVKINPKDAKARGIKNGDKVEAYNDRGHVVLKAVLSEGLRPGLVNMSRGWNINQYIDGSVQELTPSYLNPVTVNQCFYDTLVEVRKV